MKFFAVFLSLFITTVFPEEKKVENPIVFNSPARIAVRGNWDFYLSGSFLYWIPKEDGISVASIVKYGDIDAHIPAVLKTYQMEACYKPGFKAAFGLNCGCHDNWVAGGEYTRFHTKNHKLAAIPFAEIDNFEMDPAFVSNHTTLSIIDGSALYFTSSSGHWINKMDLIDVHLSRPFYSGEKLTYSFFLGLRGGWLKQYFHELNIADNVFLDSYSPANLILHGLNVSLRF